MNQLESNEFYKQTIQILESDVTKLRFENIKLEKELKKLQENLSLRSQVFFSNKILKYILVILESK